LLSGDPFHSSEKVAIHINMREHETIPRLVVPTLEITKKRDSSEVSI
jgi:hypothetical protein